MSTTVTDQDLSNLLAILYQGTVRRSSLAVTPVYTSKIRGAYPARFFLFSDISTLATAYNLPLPTSDLSETLSVGLKRGVYQRSIERGTQCGRILGASPCEYTTNEPVFVYAYNPNMLRLSSANKVFINPFVLSYQLPHQIVRFSNNHIVGYGTRGYGVSSQNQCCGGACSL